MSDTLTDGDREHFGKMAQQCAEHVIGHVGRTTYIELVDRIADALAADAKVSRSRMGGHHVALRAVDESGPPDPAA
jgi:hypothetical protein